MEFRRRMAQSLNSLDTPPSRNGERACSLCREQLWEQLQTILPLIVTQVTNNVNNANNGNGGNGNGGNNG
ncbi:hypothetical protein Tco_0831003, partial [Tanacetum coccineum]